jgi:NADPH:quinone reductase-like Zn-dependent oxidoreductase
VRVTAAGVNPLDWKWRDVYNHPLPFVLGQDFAGVVSATGDRVTKYREGERLFGVASDHGSYAEYTVVPEDDHLQPIAKIPDDVGDADAAALPTAGLTALASIDALQVGSGTTVLILGVTGGVGGFAAQIAHDRAARVIGSGRASSEQLARSLGVDEYVAFDRDDVVRKVGAAHASGVDAILDLVDDADAIKRTAELLRKGGRIVSTIGAADVDWFAKRDATAINLVGKNTPQSSHAGLRELAKMLEQGRIRVILAGERSLAQAADALDESKNGSVNGKLVLTIA